MTVKELIEELQKFDPDQLVVIKDCGFQELEVYGECELTEIGEQRTVMFQTLTEKPVVYLG